MTGSSTKDKSAKQEPAPQPVSCIFSGNALFWKKMKDIPKLFRSMVFNDAVIKQRLSQAIYKALRKTIMQGTHLGLDIANVAASAIKEVAKKHWPVPTYSSILYSVI